MNNKQQLMDAIELKTPERIPYTISYTREMNTKMCEFIGLTEGSDLAEYFNCNRFASLWTALGGSPQLPGRTERFQSAGLNVLNPIQTSATAMVPGKLKEHFGRELCFHGGVDTQDVLVSRSEQEVRDEVNMLLDTLGPNGYILAPSHVLQVDVRPENIVAMYEEAEKRA